jgi:anthranilate synthase component 2
MSSKLHAKILVLDNYDSFTYNLTALIEQIGGVAPDVVKNDRIDMELPEQYDALVLSPGPGLPSEAGKMMDVIARYAEKKPILGVCLGHQALVEHYGGSLYQAEKVYHGIATDIIPVNQGKLFKNMPQSFKAGRYHSWLAERDTFPEVLRITAEDDEGQIMAFEHQTQPVFGVQFHPESIMTPEGFTIIQHWLQEV